MQNQEPLPKPDTSEQPTDEGLDETACSRLADYLESPPPYRKHCTKEKLWLVLDAHGDSVLWSDQELAVDAAVEALNEMTMPRETFGQTVGRILSANASGETRGQHSDQP
jgi:hypothetical protein